MRLNCIHAQECRLRHLADGNGERNVIEVLCDRHRQIDDLMGKPLESLYWTDLSYCHDCSIDAHNCVQRARKREAK